MFRSSPENKCPGYCAVLYRIISNVSLQNTPIRFATPYSFSLLSRTDEAPRSENTKLPHYMRYITKQKCTKSGRHVVRSNEVSTMVPNICSFSVWNFYYVTQLAIFLEKFVHSKLNHFAGITSSNSVVPQDLFCCCM